MSVTTQRTVQRSSVLAVFAPFLLVTLIHLVAQLFNAQLLQLITKPLLIPALVLVPLRLIPAAQERTARLLIFGLALSWVGDLALMVPGEPWFILGLLCFLVAHLVYIALFIMRFTHPAALWSLAYLVWFAGLVWVLAPHLGALLVPVLVYGAVLGSMAVASTRAGLITAIGGAFFVVSDSLLALSRFLPEAGVAAAGFWAMLSYCAAQALIVWGVVRKVKR